MLRGREAVVRVVTYNLLSPALSAPEWFPFCAREAVEPRARFERIVNKLRTKVEENAVICLQEVPMQWSGPLHSFFAQHSYTMIDSLYGNSFSGYMGVAVAFPSRLYSLQDCDIVTVADTKQWAPPRTKSSSSSSSALTSAKSWGSWIQSLWLMRAARSVTRVATSTIKASVLWLLAPLLFVVRAVLPTPAKNPWDEAKSRRNTMITVQLSCARVVRADSDSTSSSSSSSSSASDGSIRSEGSGVRSLQHSFLVGVYHMPCAFYLPPMMTIHSMLAAQHMQRLARKAGGIPLILAGDFNIKPSDYMYQLLTTNEPDLQNPAHIVPTASWDSWRPQLEYPLRSAYGVTRGEPEFTNYARSRDAPVPFIGTLDYIFVSPQCHVIATDKLCSLDMARERGPRPTVQEPSDHLMLAADIAIPGTPLHTSIYPFIHPSLILRVVCVWCGVAIDDLEPPTSSTSSK